MTERVAEYLNSYFTLAKWDNREAYHKYKKLLRANMTIEELEEIKPKNRVNQYAYDVHYFIEWRKVHGDVTERMKQYIKGETGFKDMTLEELEGLRHFVDRNVGLYGLTPRIKELGGKTADGVYEIKAKHQHGKK